MKLKMIVCLGFSGNELEDSYWKEMDELTEQRVIVASEDDLPNEADALLVKLGAKVPKGLIDKLPNLKYIGMLGTGYGGIDAEYAASKGIVVTNIADYATEAVTEFTLDILLDYLRDTTRARQQSKEGNYSDDFSGSEIMGKKFGVIGLGNIGKRTAQLALAFGADVYYWSRNRKYDAERKGVKYCELDELLANSDIVTLNLAFNDETENIINAERINKIKHGAIFINPSPMELIDFDALLERLKNNDFIFILDHSDEMTKEHLEALRVLDNVIVYPAIAYLTHEAGHLKKRVYVDNIKNYLDNKPSNEVN